ncbi:MAG TPA: 30S ribosomal protein S8 [Kiritimatiellia bacterium]|nr:30S ribosomal protein S8 [Kiritimatiellia bacterium]OQC60690.1 MAG: 30S ribosomal protein S8 [Verrucomicrobia bacterium ADurb.Bin018]MBP9572100.1 30S ribosomal protein S8 [Kiritimatiellia bacterium]HOE00353.1 30S ribosomal protein S8 [Kiritimatiellia bacterium]HOE36826.1 30S ribosomal protein S8 [Kiritimatiellia bacterium]
MSCSDPIADMLTCIRNASRAGLPATEMGHSRLKAEVARILKKEGYIADVATAERDGKKVLRVTLKYDYNEKPIIQQLRRVSRPGLRRYVGAAEIPRVRGGMGTAVLSTSRGVMSDREARAARVGGEVLCQVW